VSLPKPLAQGSNGRVFRQYRLYRHADDAHGRDHRLRLGNFPPPGIGPDTFSARWSGWVTPRYSETYTFYTTSDDGVRLWVDGQLIINNWTIHPPTENSGQIALTAGQQYDIRMEYFENGGGAVAKLKWSSPSQPKGIVPQGRLYPQTSGP
jgi:hypothetical protein